MACASRSTKPSSSITGSWPSGLTSARNAADLCARPGWKSTGTMSWATPSHASICRTLKQLPDSG
jgi:hypothetical protein